MTLSTLIADVEALTGPSREVDAAVYNAIVNDGGRVAFKVQNWATEPGCRLDRWHDGWLVGKSDTDKYAEALPRYSASIDAVVALIEREMPGWYHGYHTSGGGAYEGCIYSPDYNGMGTGISAERMGASPAIALLLAFLRAIEARAG